MMQSMTGTWIIIAFAAVIVVAGIVLASIYNRLVMLRNRYLNAYAQIDVQLKRRHDLIPNLVESVKGYMAHERETLERVIQARNSAAAALAKTNPRDSSAVTSLANTENALLAALSQLMVLKES